MGSYLFGGEHNMESNKTKNNTVLYDEELRTLNRMICDFVENKSGKIELISSVPRENRVRVWSSDGTSYVHAVFVGKHSLFEIKHYRFSKDKRPFYKRWVGFTENVLVFGLDYDILKKLQFKELNALFAKLRAELEHSQEKEKQLKKKKVFAGYIERFDE